jgi:hypothetical protein
LKRVFLFEFLATCDPGGFYCPKLFKTEKIRDYLISWKFKNMKKNQKFWTPNEILKLPFQKIPETNAKRAIEQLRIKKLLPFPHQMLFALGIWAHK